MFDCLENFRVAKIPTKFVNPSEHHGKHIEILNVSIPVKFHLAQYDSQSNFSICVKLKDSNIFRLFLQDGSVIGEHAHLFRPTLLFDYEQFIMFDHRSGRLYPSAKPTLDDLVSFLARNFHVRMYIPQEFFQHPLVKEILDLLPLIDPVTFRDKDPDSNCFSMLDVMYDRKHFLDDTMEIIDLYRCYLEFAEAVHSMWLFENPLGVSIKVIATNCYATQFRDKKFL